MVVSDRHRDGISLTCAIGDVSPIVGIDAQKSISVVPAKAGRRSDCPFDEVGHTRRAIKPDASDIAQSRRDGIEQRSQ